MSEPGLLPSAVPGQQDRLWDEAPAWRNLIIGASALTLAALALPVFMPQPADTEVSPMVAQAPAPIVQTQPQPQVITAQPPAAPPRAEPPAIVPPPPRLAIPAPHPTTQLQTASLPAPDARAPSEGKACPLVGPPSPHPLGRGVVVSFEDRAVSQARIKFVEAQERGEIDPAYIDNQRVTVRLNNGHSRVLLVPKTMQVQVGDLVTAQDTYRNLNLPCNYVPNLITADLGPRTNSDLMQGAPDVKALPQK